MLSQRWRDQFNAGRATVRAAVGQSAIAQPEAPRDQDGTVPASGPNAGEVESLRALLGELHELAELSQARIAELESELTAVHGRAERLAEVLQVPGVRNVLVRTFHPDAHPVADEEQRRALTEASSKINAAYDQIDRQSGGAAR